MPNSFSLNIPETPITYHPLLLMISKALSMIDTYEVKGKLNWDVFVGGARIRKPRAKFIMALLDIIKPKYTVELGSGATTQIFGSKVGVKHYSLEHIQKFYDRTTESLAELGVDKAEVLLRPLNTETGMYVLNEGDLPKESVDLILIDGPPYHPLVNGKPKFTRANTLPALFPYMHQDTVVLLDSTERVPEQEVLVGWVRDYGIAFENPVRLKGLGVIDPWASTRDQ